MARGDTKSEQVTLDSRFWKDVGVRLDEALATIRSAQQDPARIQERVGNLIQGVLSIVTKGLDSRYKANGFAMVVYGTAIEAFAFVNGKTRITSSTLRNNLQQIIKALGAIELGFKIPDLLRLEVNGRSNFLQLTEYYSGISRKSIPQIEKTSFHTETIACLVLLSMIQDPGINAFIKGELEGKLKVYMSSVNAFCLGCQFSLIELKILAAIADIDLQIDFQFLQPFQQANFADYIDKFSVAMEELIETIPDPAMRKAIQDLLDQFSGMENRELRWEWVQKFLSTPLSALARLPGGVIKLEGIYLK